eukprot:8174570-Alexandrium_andersonii.AAC.1
MARNVAPPCAIRLKKSQALPATLSYEPVLSLTWLQPESGLNAHACPGMSRAPAQRTNNPSCSRAQLTMKRHAALRNTQAQCCS